jgi:hypothetical protein
MILFDVEDRLFAVDDQATRGFVWREDLDAWHPIQPEGAGKAFAVGHRLTLQRAAIRFPAAKLDAIPPL